MTEAAIYQETGLVITPKYTCYKDNNRLCKLRRLSDSKFECSMNPITCIYSQKGKNE